LFASVGLPTESAEAVLAHHLDSGCAIGGIGRVAVEVKDGRRVIPRRRMPRYQGGAIDSRNFDFFDAIETSLGQRDACWIMRSIDVLLDPSTSPV
jgi:hypothetical protein